MSHNVTLNGVKITDLSLLAHAIKKVVGNKATLNKQASTFRTYRGQPNNCDAAILLSEGKHDIGLSKQSDDAYTAVFDPYAMSSMFKSPHAIGGSSDPAGHIGMLLQEYGLATAEYKAAQNGMSTTRIQGEKGLVSLEITDNA